jgi:hypothetical protein
MTEEDTYTKTSLDLLHDFVTSEIQVAKAIGDENAIIPLIKVALEIERLQGLED